MVMNNHSYEDQTRRLLAETKSELTAIGNQMAELQQRWETLKKEAEAYETALQGYLRRAGKQEVIETDWDKLLGGKSQTHKKRLITIARRNGGRIRVTQATDILYSKGFIKSKRRANAYQIVSMLLADMTDDGQFKKVAPGEYRFVSSQRSLLGVS